MDCDLTSCAVFVPLPTRRDRAGPEIGLYQALSVSTVRYSFATSERALPRVSQLVQALGVPVRVALTRQATDIRLYRPPGLRNRPLVPTSLVGSDNCPKVLKTETQRVASVRHLTPGGAC